MTPSPSPTKTKHSRRVVVSAALAAAALTAGAALAPSQLGAAPGAASASAGRGGPAGNGDVGIEVLSNRADLISGGDALVAVALPSGAVAEDLEVTVGGRDVTDVFEPDADGRMVGLVDGLENGKNRLVARLPDGRGARIVITNHPIGGPVFSGPQVQPWVCSTVENQLGPPQDEQCNAAPVYRETVLANGVTVGIERGTMNRGIYDIAMPSNWNHKLVWVFGFACDHFYHQGTPASTLVAGPAVPPGAGTALGAEALERGFAVVAHSMTEYNQHCNDVTSAESVMMLQEYIRERYGPIRYTIGQGGSGGAMQQNLITANYPGLLDGVQPAASFADSWSAGAMTFADCSLLVRHWESSPLWSDPADRAAASGHGEENTGPCEQAGGAAARYLHPSEGSPVACARDATYDAASNRDGARCSMQDYQAAVFGKRRDGFAWRPYDNVGVQYGLRALEAGEITAKQFVDLNEHVGGYDIDLNWKPRRRRASTRAVQIAYRSGRVASGRHQANAAMIYPVNTDNNDYHLPVAPYITQARLRRDAGGGANQVLWTAPPAELSSLDVLDQWLEAVDQDRRNMSLPRKIVANRPPEAVDACWIDGEQVTDADRCREAYPYFDTVRIAAGGPTTDDVLKCRRKPLRRSDYTTRFTDRQWRRLRATFPTGVCDWSKPGIGQRPNLAWMAFADGPGGRPLGAPPRSVSFGS